MTRSAGRTASAAGRSRGPCPGPAPPRRPARRPARRNRDRRRARARVQRRRPGPRSVAGVAAKLQPRVLAGRVEGRQQRPGQPRRGPRTANRDVPSPVAAGTRTRSATWPSRTNPAAPSRTQPSAHPNLPRPRAALPPPAPLPPGRGRARRPPPGSVPGMATVAISSPAAMAGSQRRCAASSADSSSAAAASTAVLRKGPQNNARPISWATMPSSVQPAPAPPCVSGIARPSSPSSSAIRCQASAS